MDDLTQSQPKMTWFKAVLFFGMLLFGFYASTHMVAAGDTWVALACGRHFDNHGVDTVEPFSFNSHPAGPSDETLEKFPEWTHGMIRKWHPTGWLNQNWLTHLGFYKLATWFGSDGNYNYDALVYWKFAVYILAVFAVYGVGKTLGAGDTLSAAAACLAMVIGRSFYDIRPAAYSNMLVPVFVLILALAVCKNYRLIWLVVPVVVFWANVHGGYIYAFIMFVPFIGVNLLCLVPRRWTVSLGMCGLWLLLYLLSYKFITGYVSQIEHYFSQVQTVFAWDNARTAQAIKKTTEKVFGYDPSEISLLGNKLFWSWFVLACISVSMTCFKQVKAGVFYFFHFFVGGVYILCLLPRFSTTAVNNLPKYFASDAAGSLMTFFFVFLAAAVMILLMAMKKNCLKYLPAKGLYHSIAAAAASLVAMIVFNPFHLTNITHTFEISISKHAESWRQVNEWKPAFDWMDKTSTRANPVGNEEWFGALCVLTAAAIVIWLVSYLLKPVEDRTGRNRKPIPTEAETEGAFAWPKINLPIIVIALLTIYMAIRSRRFIALAGSAAAPVLVMFIWQSWQMISARIRFNRSGEMKAWTLPAVAQYAIKGAICIALASLTIFWGAKYKRIYLDPWSTNHEYNSVFMRMTASHLKPTDVCQFLRDNDISGKVFNYWTEGGAVAFGQTPDPETGHVPLKLFMDGRAQAAYNHDKFKLWQHIFAGGPIAQKVKGKKETMTPEKQKAIGNWITQQIGDEVWIVLMPQQLEDRTLVESLMKTGHWKSAYVDDYQRILVNVKTDQGQSLIHKILNDDAVFPNVHAKNMTTFAAITENRAQQRYNDLYPLASEAVKDFPSPTAMLLLLQLKKQPQAAKDLQVYVDDFLANREAYQKEDGYYQRLVSVRLAAKSLINEASNKEKEKYTALLNETGGEIKDLKEHSIW